MLYFICCIVCIVYCGIHPQSLSDGHLLVFPCWVGLLFDRDADGLGPVGAAVEAVVLCGCVVVRVLLFVLACCTVVGGADWVETVRGAVAAHVAWSSVQRFHRGNHGSCWGRRSPCFAGPERQAWQWLWLAV